MFSFFIKFIFISVFSMTVNVDAEVDDVCKERDDSS